MTLPWPGRGGGASTASEFDPANDSSLAKSPTDRPANAASRFGGLDANSGSVESDWDVGTLTLGVGNQKNREWLQVESKTDCSRLKA